MVSVAMDIGEPFVFVIACTFEPLSQGTVYPFRMNIDQVRGHAALARISGRR